MPFLDHRIIYPGRPLIDICLGAVNKLCNAEVREGESCQELSYYYSLIKVNQNFDQKPYMGEEGSKMAQFGVT